MDGAQRAQVQLVLKFGSVASCLLCIPQSGDLVGNELNCTQCARVAVDDHVDFDAVVFAFEQSLKKKKVSSQNWPRNPTGTSQHAPFLARLLPFSSSSCPLRSIYLTTPFENSPIQDHILSQNQYYM